MRTVAVVVTYNRKNLLELCLQALVDQTKRSDVMVIIDNASTDGTGAWLRKWVAHHSPRCLLRSLDSNTGGAGGFSRGLDLAIEQGADWIWMMDDDAEPHPDALAELMKVAIDPGCIYGSLAVSGDETSWEMTLIASSVSKTRRAADIPDQAEVEMLPLLGLLVHRDLVGKIGGPDAGLFIAGDDVEYCLRARRAGARIVIAGRSRIEHPKSVTKKIPILGRQVTYLSLPPWKRYYDTRNRLLIARQYHGWRLITQTIPASLLRLFVACRVEKDRMQQTRAFFAGLYDGLFGIKGKRHDHWGLK